MRLEIGVSQREAWSRCPRYWYWNQVAGNKGWGIVPAMEALPLSWGRLGHAGLAAWYAALREKVADPVQVGLDAIDAELARHLDGMSPEQLEQYVSEHNKLGLVRSFLRGYASWFGAGDSQWEVLAIEWEFCLPAEEFYPPAVVTVARAASSHILQELPAVRGTVDLLVRDPHRGLLVMDHKFNTSVQTDLETGLRWWPQPIVYCRAVELTWNEAPHYVHNQVRKPAPGLKPRKQDDGSYESAEEFQQRLNEEYLCYPDYSEKYTGNKKGYFFRSEPLDATASEEFLLEQARLDVEIASTRVQLPDAPGLQDPLPGLVPRRSPRVACGLYGKKCPYSALCELGCSPATMEAFMERDEPHP